MLGASLAASRARSSCGTVIDARKPMIATATSKSTIENPSVLRISKLRIPKYRLEGKRNALEDRDGMRIIVEELDLDDKPRQRQFGKKTSGR